MRNKSGISNTEFFVLDILQKSDLALTVEDIFKTGKKEEYIHIAPNARSTIDRTLAKLKKRNLVEVAHTQKKRAVQLHYWRIKDRKKFTELRDEYIKKMEEEALNTKSSMLQFFYIDPKCFYDGQCDRDWDECWDDKIEFLELCINRKLSKVEINKLKSIGAPGLLFRVISYINVLQDIKDVEEEIKPILEVLELKSLFEE